MERGSKHVTCRIFCGALLTAALIAGCSKDYSHEQFRQLVIDKSPAEVRSAVGEPSLIRQGNPVTWQYYRRTYDRQHNDDYRASIQFERDPKTGQDKAVKIEFDQHA